MRINALAQWFGGNRMLAESVGKALGRLRWCGVPFAGGCPELPLIQIAAGVANGLHRHRINLARVVRDEGLVEQLVRRLDGVLFHADELAEAQRRCRERERSGQIGDHPLIRELYPPPRWTWLGQTSRNQRNGEIAEVLIVNGGRPT